MIKKLSHFNSAIKTQKINSFLPPIYYYAHPQHGPSLIFGKYNSNKNASYSNYLKKVNQEPQYNNLSVHKWKILQDAKISSNKNSAKPLPPSTKNKYNRLMATNSILKNFVKPTLSSSPT
jgi:hypothetical protein